MLPKMIAFVAALAVASPALAEGPIWCPSPAPIARPAGVIFNQLPYPQVRLFCGPTWNVNAQAPIYAMSFIVEACSFPLPGGRWDVYVPKADESFGYTPRVVRQLIQHEYWQVRLKGVTDFAAWSYECPG